MKFYAALLVAIFLSHEWRRCDAVQKEILKQCVSKNTCQDCLQANSFCAWCSDWYYSNSTVEKPRCNVPKSLKEFGCPPEEIQYTPLGSVEILEDSMFQDMEAGRTPIQLKPQRVKIKIPFNSNITIPLRYRMAKYVRLADYLHSNMNKANEPEIGTYFRSTYFYKVDPLIQKAAEGDHESIGLES